VPWPSHNIYARLPWREQLLWGLLGADVVSFHTDDYRYNFLRSVARQLGDSGVEVRGSSVRLPDRVRVACLEREDGLVEPWLHGAWVGG
jgi:trehalose 6-phosphate synthase